ncbi:MULTISPECIES: undecaprenyl-phosphate glucose phosphotransferase [Methylosinus]|uniref:Undecaprenyl-phosphate glucose phosphotransferase n=1 Tax=Methylosinus sporium TaxID=428 RepID=A0A2U1SNI0_METSR|nr:MULTISPECIES: undecaprenyl-phosphate glucose phosphotransferase [Methylosinus]PWB93171.1 undecaprenyl-phosphate glucose phosphotransferase [Methylosinus sporium]
MCAFALRDIKAAPPVNDDSRAASRLAEISADARPTPAYSPIVLAGLVRSLEFLLITAVGFAVHRLHVAPGYGYGVEYFVVIPGMALLSVLAWQAFDLYTPAAFRAPIGHGSKLAAGWTLVFLAALAAIFFLKLDNALSRVWLLGWYAGGLGVLAAERFAVSAIVRTLTQQGKLDRRTVIVGGGPMAEPVLRDLAAAQQDSDLRILGIFDDRRDDRSPDVVAGYPKLGTIDDLVEFARHTRLDLVIFTLPISAEARLLQMLRKLWVLPIDIRLAAHTNKLRFRPRSYSYIGNVPVLDVFDKPIADWDVLAKSAFDKVVGALCLILFAPVMAAVALAIKLDSRGPVLFRQTRYGFNNERIEVYKFRSMYADKLDPAAAKLVTKGDPRVTRVGRFIRKTSLDELPQLFNVVFKGNLSLVGPRPHAMHARAAEHLYDEVVDGYFARHRVKPGLTGWAQINGWRGETDTPEKIQKRVECDLYYIENWSILLDIYILALTPIALLKTENAY